MSYPKITIAVPSWVDEYLRDHGPVYTTDTERMRLAIELSRYSMDHGGGPFGAAVFDLNSHRLIAPGVNQVVASNCSAAHAEMVALMVAQQVLGNYDLGGEGLPACELMTSTEPCVQCFGGIMWSGIRQVVYGARSGDAEAIGFREGTKPENWVKVLGERNIHTVWDVLREEAVEVLEEYRSRGLPIYNPKH